MSYFGGSGAGKGWLKLRVLPDPELLRAMLTCSDSILYRDHQFTEGEGVRAVEDVVSEYQRFIQSWTSPRLCTAGRCGFDRFRLASRSNVPTLHKTNDQTLCYWQFNDPVVLFHEALVSTGPDGRLFTNLVDGSWCGLEVLYPSVFSTKATGWKGTSTEGMADRRTFLDIQHLVRESTRPITFVVDGMEKRSRIRVSPAMHGHAVSVFNRDASTLRIAE